MTARVESSSCMTNSCSTLRRPSISSKRRRVRAKEPKRYRSEESTDTIASTCRTGLTCAIQMRVQVQQQMDEFQHSLSLLKNTVTQFRSEVEVDRNERWKADTERNQWMTDLRAAVAKIDASMDGKIVHHMERFNSKLVTDKMDVMRLLEEYRELMTGADFKRISNQMMEFSRINDHLLALERWIHTEFGHIKRVFQFITTDTEGRLQSVTLEIIAGMKHWNTVLVHQEDEYRSRLQDIHDAVREVSHAVQKKLFALEEVLPMEVKARQQNDDKLRQRVESVAKSLSRAMETTREECISPQAQLSSRMANLEEAQRHILDQVSDKQEAMKETIQEFTKDSDTMLSKLADYVEQERQKMASNAAPIRMEADPSPIEAAPPAVAIAAEVQESALTAASSLDTEPGQATDSARPTASSLTAVPSPEMLASMRAEWVTYFETQIPTHLTELKYALFDDIDEKVMEVIERSGVQEQVQNLQTWTISHAQECRQCYEYLTWALDAAKSEEVVAKCLGATIDQVVEMAALEDIQLLKDNSAWTMEQLGCIRQTQQQEVLERRAQERGSSASPATAISDEPARHEEEETRAEPAHDGVSGDEDDADGDLWL